MILFPACTLLLKLMEIMQKNEVCNTSIWLSYENVLIHTQYITSNKIIVLQTYWAIFVGQCVVLGCIIQDISHLLRGGSQKSRDGSSILVKGYSCLPHPNWL